MCEREDSGDTKEKNIFLRDKKTKTHKDYSTNWSSPADKERTLQIHIFKCLIS